MDIKRAREMLTILADGVNPLTGEILPDNDSCNQVEIVRALHAVLNTLDQYSKSEKKLPANAGIPWSAQEDSALLDQYNKGLTVAELAAEHKRSKGAIRSRLTRLVIENK